MLENDTTQKNIHYVWVGNNKKNKTVKKYINSWKRYFPGYNIMEWNEQNFDINSVKYVKEAYESKKYAFVSDYIRLYALYNYGGIYFDTDVEVIKTFEHLLEKEKDIYGFELENKVMTGVMIGRKHSNIIKEFMNYYNDRSFIKINGEYDLTPNTNILTEILYKRGIELNNRLQIKKEFNIYPIEYFTGFDLKNSSQYNTENTVTIHHYSYSWAPKRVRFLARCKKILAKILGRKIYEKIRKIKKKGFEKKYENKEK